MIWCLKNLRGLKNNNRALINDYLSNVNEHNNSHSQINLYCSMPNEELTSTKHMRQTYTNLPRVTSVLTTSATGDDTSVNDIFRTTMSSFSGNKKDVRVRIGNSGRLRNLTSQEVKSVTRDNDEHRLNKDVYNDFIDENEKIKEGKPDSISLIIANDDAKSSDHSENLKQATLIPKNDSLEHPMSPPVKSLEFSPDVKHINSDRKPGKLYRFNKEMNLGNEGKTSRNNIAQRKSSLNQAKMSKKHSMKSLRKNIQKLQILPKLQSKK